MRKKERQSCKTELAVHTAVAANIPNTSDDVWCRRTQKVYF